MPCNAICLPTYRCGAIQKVRPEAGAVYAPYVTMTLGSQITVGNKSYQAEPHTAVIKSMDYGGSDGSGVTIEITDEAGSSFERYFEKMNKDICSASRDYDMKIDFGWLAKTCDGTVIKTGIPEGPVTFVPLEMESSYEGGVIKYTLKGKDLLDRMGENRVEAPVGTEANKVRLQPAMREVLQRNCPPINNLRFMRRQGDSLSEWRFRNSDGGPEGPMSVWPADQQNVMSVLRKWGNSVTTDRKKGWTPVWNPGSPQPELWLLEDTRTYCDEATDSDGLTCIGTYIVNGGDCSPVISFSPQAKWIMSANLGSGGNSGGATSARTPTQQRRRFPERACADSPQGGGTPSQFPAAQNDINWRPPDLVTIKQQEALAKHELAAQYRELAAPMEAELKIMGNPAFVHPIAWVGKKAAIIVINPFHIFSGGSYCEWLAGPMCNPIYSDKSWMILGVSHQIQEGAFTTTFKVCCNNLTKTEI